MCNVFQDSWITDSGGSMGDRWNEKVRHCVDGLRGWYKYFFGHLRL